MGTATLIPATFPSSSFAAAGGPPLSRSLLAQRNQNRSTVVAQHGMVCTAVPLASMAGVDVLKAGGNAIDAAIAANAMLSLVEPMSCGPGGDLFAIVWSEKDQKLFGLNASGRAPYDWSLQQALDLGLKEIPVYQPAGVERARLRQRLGSPAQAVRQAALRPAPGAGDSTRQGTAFPSRRSSRQGGSPPRAPTGRA